MKRRSLMVVCLVCLLIAVPLSAQTKSNLVKLSEGEYVDLAQISFVRFSRIVDLSSQGGDNEFKVSSLVIANGATTLSNDGENRLKEVLPAHLTKLSDFEYIDMRRLYCARIKTNWVVVGGSSVGLSPGALATLGKLLAADDSSQ